MRRHSLYAFILTIACGLYASLPIHAQDCVIPVNVVVDKNLCNIPEASCASLENSLRRIALQSGITTDLGAATQFVLTASAEVLDEHVLPGPPRQYVANVGLTLYIADVTNHKQFASTYIEADGVGNTKQLCLTNAFKTVRGDATKVSSFLEDGKYAIISYFDNQYPNIIREAQRAASLQNYEEALILCLSVPTCSKGYDACTEAGLEIYEKYRDKYNQMLLQKAQALWASQQDAEGATSACEILAAIDPDAKCYTQASSLMAEIKKQVRSDIDFEMRQKYNDQVSIEKQRIEAARAVGVAFGKGQKQTTTNLMWLR